MAPRPIISRAGLAVGADGARAVTRALPEETPVAISFHGETLAVMMASPADLDDFAYGFALTEGVIDSVDEVEELVLVEHPNGLEAQFLLRDDKSEALRARQRSMTGPVGCGLCGIDSLEQAVRALPDVSAARPAVSRADIASAPDALRGMQPMHDQTRAVHAAGFLRPGAGLVLAREDVGRHNALDKLIGALARSGIDAAEGAIVLTSRVSVEMVQKTAMAGCGILIAASAPTAHALRLAEDAGMTLAAFARAGGFDLYSHPDRIVTGASDVA